MSFGPFARPPRLVVKTLAITFTMVAVLLVTVFLVFYVSMRDQVRRGVIASLESSQRVVSAVETRRHRELRGQAENLAENPTLKAALDTYAAEAHTGDESTQRQLLTMIDLELDKVAARFDADAIVVADAKNTTLAAAGRLKDRWPAGRLMTVVGDDDAGGQFDGVAQMDGGTFRVVAVPLLVANDGVIGTLYVATSLDERYATELKNLSGAETIVMHDGVLLASTLTPQAAREFETTVARTRPLDGIVPLAGESMAFRQLASVGSTSFYALGSIDRSSKAAMRQAVRSLVFIDVGAVLLALVGSFTLARRFTHPIERLSASLASMAASHDVTARLTASGSSRELDALTDTFNALMTSLAEAEAQTEAAYTGAIRALAAALDARDPYTAGHSDRVSVLSVAIGRTLGLAQEEVEVVRLGALLHDIGKIGVPDHILRKPAPLNEAEYDAIKAHPVLGARILRLVPFLARHIPIVELHHERPDGKGYPLGLRGDDTPLAARIVHVADAYDAITTARAYRRARPPAEALQELWRCSGSEFDAEIVGALATVLPGLTSSEVAHAAEPVYA